MRELAFILNIIGLAFCIFSSLIKGEKITKILILVLIGNMLVALGYICDGSGINGAASGILACVQIFINFLFQRKNKPIPIWLIGIYALSFIVVNLIVSGISFPTVLSILACMAFIMTILQKNGKNYRICGIINTVIWIVYDLVTASYPALITHGTILAVTVVGVLIHDLKRKKA